MSTAISILEVALLGLATLPFLRLVACRPLLRMFPRVYATVLLVLALWAAGVAVFALAAPVGLHPLTAVAGAVLVVTTVRARTGFGRRLPPGSLSLVDSVRAVVDRRFYFERARRLGPIFKTAQFNRNVVCVVGLERGHRLLRDHAASIEPSPQTFTREVSGGFLRYMEGDTYSLYGSLFRKGLARPVMAPTASVAAEVTRRELDRAAADGARSPSGAVRPGPYLERIVHAAFLRALFGIQPGSEKDRRLAEPFRAFAHHSLAASLDSPTKDGLALLRRSLAEHEASAGAERCALTELRRLDPRMPDETCLDNLLFTHKIASANVVGLLHWLLEILGQHPDWVARARAELDSASPDGPEFVHRLVLETLRLAQSEYLYRQIKEEIDYEGFRLPAGWLLRVCVWESHRSAETFDDPEEFDPDRFIGSSFTASQYSPFGWGEHACNGVPLVMLVSRTFVEELVRGYDWAVTSNGSLEREFRHWSHWRPSSKLRLRLEPAGDTGARPASPADLGAAV